MDIVSLQKITFEYFYDVFMHLLLSAFYRKLAS